MSSMPTRQWFQPGEGIAREVITADIQRYLGPDALVKPGDHEGVDGYWITAYRTLTSQMVQDLKLDSQRWRGELQQGRVAYQDSRTHQSRQYYGPSAPAEPPYQQQTTAQPTYRQDTRPQQQLPYAQPTTAGYTYATPQPQPQAQAPQGYVLQGGQYVPASDYGQSQPRTTYTYAQAPPGGGSHYQEAQGYGYQASTSAQPREQVYPQPQQPSSQPQYSYADPRGYQQPQQPGANERRRRQ